MGLIGPHPGIRMLPPYQFRTRFQDSLHGEGPPAGSVNFTNPSGLISQLMRPGTNESLRSDLEPFGHWCSDEWQSTYDGCVANFFAGGYLKA
jgi:hypothetical protein